MRTVKHSLASKYAFKSAQSLGWPHLPLAAKPAKSIEAAVKLF